METNLFENLCRYIGQTITVFTTSGGQSGSGFTGVLASVDNHTLKLITSIGASPSCPLGSNCSGGNYYNNYQECNNNQNYNCNYNFMGSVTEIPLCRIASFTHNAI